jgi:hypothetical protein
MTGFIAYFDYLGYKAFVMNNDSHTLSDRSGHIMRDIEMALSLGKNREDPIRGNIPDLSFSKLHCINMSDTVVLITLNESLSSLEELLKVSKLLNHSGAFRTMPLRGAICYGEFNMRIGQQKNKEGAIYSANLIYGSVLI